MLRAIPSKITFSCLFQPVECILSPHRQLLSKPVLVSGSLYLHTSQTNYNRESLLHVIGLTSPLIMKTKVPIANAQYKHSLLLC